MSKCLECEIKKEVDPKYWVDDNLLETIRNLNNRLKEIEPQELYEKYEEFIRHIKNLMDNKELMEHYEICNYFKTKYIAYYKYLLKGNNDAELVYNYFTEMGKNKHPLCKDNYNIFIREIKNLGKDMSFKNILKHISMQIQKNGSIVEQCFYDNWYSRAS